MKRAQNGQSTPPRLSEAEWAIMKPFWEKGALAARDLYAALPTPHNWSYKTAKTMLARLVKKGALHYRQVGNSYLYEARFSRDEMVKAAVKQFAHRVLDGALQPFLVNFFAGKNPSREEISALREMIKHLEAKKSVKKERGNAG